MSINQTIAALPTPPTRSQPSTFDDRADAFLSAIPNMADEINLWTGELNTTQGQIQTSEMDAANAAAASLASQTAAAISAASAVTAPGTSAASSTSLQIINGPKALTIQTGKDFVKGQLVSIASDADPSGAAMYGAITDYNATTGALSVNVSNNVGVGTFSDWVIGLIGSWLPVFYVADELAWHTVTADYSAVAGQRLFVDVSAGPLTITLPPIVSGVEWLEISCAIGDFRAHPITIARNEATIGGLAEDMTIGVMIRFEMVVDASGNWRVV